METSTAAQITQALNELDPADREAWERLLPHVYDELYRRSERSLRGERPGHTLEPTALVNEVFLKLAHDDRTIWKDRGHFFCVASRIMRHILINHARDRRARKRGGGRGHVPLEAAACVAGADAGTVDVLALDEALTALSAVDPEKARVVELRFFGECTIEETAEALGISTATVERHWRFARVWLQSRLEP